ncbi:cystatin [Xenopus laevis]|uniref:Cystatin n=2 Tax=Xenopus laevis TaxID=8355 RepID=A0A1L8G787_XENLA|nr:cystatin [Xenopus laevis]XP_018118351.1 cystatin [Xenopus laevis]XP_018118352.1 cystatin [Xenopus laevis]XP_018118353.1 cystatin [Xenopus laevis]OCT79758.1 hypothetical protein XELAEV_18026568mg [Xenopus laevis]
MASSLYLGLALSFALLATVVPSGMLVGAPVTTNPNTEEVKNATTFALEKFNRMSNDVRLYKLVQMISVESQVVAGVNYFLKMKIGVTSCRKNAEHNLESCELEQGNDAEAQICTFKVYVVSWRNEMSLSESNCEAA